LKIRDAHIHIIAEGQCFDKEHGMAQFFRVLQKDNRVLIFTGLSFHPILMTCWYIGGINPFLGIISIGYGADVNTYIT
jgi:hypothetical protein